MKSRSEEPKTQMSTKAVLRDVTRLHKEARVERVLSVRVMGFLPSVTPISPRIVLRS